MSKERNLNTSELNTSELNTVTNVDTPVQSDPSTQPPASFSPGRWSNYHPHNLTNSTSLLFTMSTQGPSSIPFTITHPQENIRLLELPPELLKIIEDKTDPKICLNTTSVSEIYRNHFGGRIQLKSAPTDNTTTSTKPKDQHLHLCTETHVWAVRQVSTSNSVYVLRPAPPVSEPSTHTHTDFLPSPPGSTAFAQPTSTLELLPLFPSPEAIDAAIAALLPPTHPAPSDSALKGSEPPDSPFTLDALKAALPFPHIALAQALRRNFVFEYGSASGAFVPSDELLLKAWREFMLCIDAQKIDLAEWDVRGLPEVMELMAVDEGMLLPSVLARVVEEFWDGEAWAREKGVEGEMVELERRVGMLEGRLRGRELVRWVGVLLVRCEGSGAGVEREKLVDEWQGLVPRKWWGCCEVEELGKEVVVGEDGVVRWKGKSAGRSEDAGEKVKEKEASGKGSSLGKRNWHEMFAAQRKR
jgi:sister chromatid cohesion protein DCC1